MYYDSEIKEKWSEKVSTKQNPGESFLFKILKKDNTLFKLLLNSIIKIFIFKHCFIVRWDVAMQCSMAIFKWCVSMRMLIACCPKYHQVSLG